MRWIIKLDEGLARLSNLYGWIACVAMILMAANVFYDVVARYAFNDVSISMQEMEWHLYSPPVRHSLRPAHRRLRAGGRVLCTLEQQNQSLDQPGGRLHLCHPVRLSDRHLRLRLCRGLLQHGRRRRRPRWPTPSPGDQGRHPADRHIHRHRRPQHGHVCRAGHVR